MHNIISTFGLYNKSNVPIRRRQVTRVNDLDITKPNLLNSGQYTFFNGRIQRKTPPQFEPLNKRQAMMNKFRAKLENNNNISFEGVRKLRQARNVHEFITRTATENTVKGINNQLSKQMKLSDNQTKLLLNALTSMDDDEVGSLIDAVKENDSSKIKTILAKTNAKADYAQLIKDAVNDINLSNGQNTDKLERLLEDLNIRTSALGNSIMAREATEKVKRDIMKKLNDPQSVAMDLFDTDSDDNSQPEEPVVTTEAEAVNIPPMILSNEDRIKFRNTLFIENLGGRFQPLEIIDLLSGGDKLIIKPSSSTSLFSEIQLDKDNNIKKVDRNGSLGKKVGDDELKNATIYKIIKKKEDEPINPNSRIVASIQDPRISNSTVESFMVG